MYCKMLECLANKEISLTGDSFKAVLLKSSYVPNQDTHKYLADLALATNEITGATAVGYTANGFAIPSPTFTLDAANNKWTWDASDVTLPNTTITARYLAVYDDTPAANKPLMFWVDFGQDVSSSTGNFTISWNASGVFTLTVAA
jgi:hypothetical protein